MTPKASTAWLTAVGSCLGMFVLAGGQGIQSAAAQPPAGQRGSAPAIVSAGPTGARNPRNAEELDQMFKQISNWGRWGKDDQLGSVNLVTNTKRKQAAALVKSGVSVSLAHNPLKEAAEDVTSPFEHTMDTMNRGFLSDTYRVSYHGFAHSHIDALCHILYKDQTYNGYARAEIGRAHV